MRFYDFWGSAFRNRRSSLRPNGKNHSQRKFCRFPFGRFTARPTNVLPAKRQSPRLARSSVGNSVVSGQTAERASSRSVWDLKAGLSGVFPLPGCSAGLLAPLFEPRQRTVLPPTRPAAVAYRFRSERPATSSYDRRTSLLISLSGTSRSKRTLIQCRLFIW